MSKYKVYLKEVTTTNAWVNSALDISIGNGLVSTKYPLDQIELDSSVPVRDKYNRPDTHFQVDYDLLPENPSSNIWDTIRQELKFDIDSSTPYKDMYDKIKQAIKNFYE